MEMGTLDLCERSGRLCVLNKLGRVASGKLDASQ